MEEKKQNLENASTSTQQSQKPESDDWCILDNNLPYRFCTIMNSI